MDGQRNFNRTDRNRGSGIYRCSDYGKKKKIKKTIETAMKLTMLGTGNAMVTNCYNTCFAF